MVDKVIVITGANGGLGRALAQRFASDGEQVVLLGRTLAKVQEVASSIGERAMAAACDVMSPASVKAAFAEIAGVHPRIDVLINNAAVFDPFLIEEASDDQIMNGILTNLAGPMLCSRSAIPMLERGGLIINISSESVDMPFPHLLVYQSTKAGLERFSKGLQLELENRDIRVTTVRAGQMTGPGQSAVMEPEAGMRFFQACLQRGFNPMERGSTQYESATGLFRYLIDLPADMHLDIATYQARKSG
ncbi:SDR family oxidoreductase [Novosphingobium sp. G106]|uniref:SDR family oxidoreductase n=1 Tax=Novosphingobium sp. G106 TaxID=2849500 RepID=UPI001C2DE1A8|nr:SDR family oxidoreductase [Novosphingobium sp. G106]MBV1686136.1 SDR family oxidoreductase [Novosphingobium sp. G106]